VLFAVFFWTFMWGLFGAFIGVPIVLARGLRRGATSRDAADLMKWAEAYWSRQTPSSFAGHSKMFNDFSGAKLRLENREQVAELLGNLRAGMIIQTPRM
jgi:hypothetical protein